MTATDTTEAPWRLPAVATGAVAVLAATWVAAEQRIFGWEVSVGQWAYDLPDQLTPVLEVVMQAGTRIAAITAAVVVAVVAGWRWRAVGVAAAGFLARAGSGVVKDVVDRPRPSLATLGREPRELIDTPAFTSSHTAIATALAVALVLLGRPRRATAAALFGVAALTGLARMHLGVHWALDVVGGAALGAIVAVVVSLAVGLPPTGPVRRAGADDELVVASFNLRNGRAWDGLDSWPFRARRAAHEARSLGADVLGVQEAFGFQSRFLGAALPGYVRVGRGRGRVGGEWCAVYLRDDRLEVLDDVTRWYGPEPERPGSKHEGASFPRTATHLRLRVRTTGVELQLVNTHLDARHAELRAASVEQLLSWLAPDVPTVVLGDLNATRDRDQAVFERFEAAGFVDALPDDGLGTAHDFHGGTDHARLDHILVRGPVEVVRGAVVADDRTRRLPSDHWPVVAHLRIGSRH